MIWGSITASSATPGAKTDPLPATWDPMGRRGPKTAPLAVQLAKGESRPSRVNHAEPNLPATSAEPPASLSGIGRPDTHAGSK
jgi:hypothetical protein